MQHGCHTIKNSQKIGDCQNFNVFKMQQGSILTLFVFHKAFQKGRDTSQRGHILFCIPLVPPSRGQTSVTTKPQEKEEPRSCASAAPREPCREQAAVAPHLRAGRADGRASSPSGWQQSASQSSEVWLWRGKTPGSHELSNWSFWNTEHSSCSHESEIRKVCFWDHEKKGDENAFLCQRWKFSDFQGSQVTSFVLC